MMDFSLWHGVTTPEFGDALIVINVVTLSVLALVLGSEKIVAGSTWLARTLERFKCRRAAHKN
jgi:hypothetical protein